MEITTSHAGFDEKGVVEQFSSYVHSIARQIKRSLSSNIELDDLVAYGMTGLLEAAKRFDPKIGANFTTFSYYRIRGAIYDGLRGMGYVSRTEYQKIRFSERATAYLEQTANSHLGSTAHVKADDQFEALANQVAQLGTIFITSLETATEESYADQRPRQDANLEERELKKLLYKALASLSEQERMLIQLYYFEELTLEEVGQKIGLSKSWTCRCHAKAIERLTEGLQRALKSKISN